MQHRARAAGIRNVSLDLIVGLPGQTRDSWGRSLDQTLELRPEHVSLYLFEVDEKSRLGREVLSGGARYRAAQVPEEDFFVESYFKGKRRLEQAGYEGALAASVGELAVARRASESPGPLAQASKERPCRFGNETRISLPSRVSS